MKKYYFYMLAGAMAIAAACTEDPAKESIKVSMVKFNETLVSIPLTDPTRTLQYEVLPENATNKEVTWQSTNPNVASVENGVVTALYVGETDITVTTKDAHRSAQCHVVVTADRVAVDTIILVSPEYDTLYIGQTKALLVSVLPEIATNATLLYSSNASAVVSVNAAGQMRGLTLGDAVISVKTNDEMRGGDERQIVRQCSIHVVNATPSGIKITQRPAISLTVNNTQTLTYSILPAGAPQTGEVVWSSNADTIATVSSTGEVRGIAAGRAIVRAVFVDGGFKDSCIVNVSTQADTGVRFVSTDTLVMAPGGTKRVVVSVLPATATDKTVSVSTSNASVVSSVTMAHDTAVITAASGAADGAMAAVYVTSASGKKDTLMVKIDVNAFNYIDLPRTGWTVTTETHVQGGRGYVCDGATSAGSYNNCGSGYPEDMFDGNPFTYLAFIKSAECNSGSSIANTGYSTTDITTAPYFTVDMQAQHEFNYIIWEHRHGTAANSNASYTNNNVTPAVTVSSTGLNNNSLRVLGVRVEGSNDGVTFMTIAPADPQGTDQTIVWIPSKEVYNSSTATVTETGAHKISVQQSNYRYVRVHVVVHNKNYKAPAGDVCGYQHPDKTGTAGTGGNSVQIAEFGLGRRE